jgi:hypothetical protein
MAQHSPPPGDDLDQVGEYALEERLRRDRLGEVFRGRGPAGLVRIRLCRVSGAPDRLVEALTALEGVHAPAVAPLLDRLADASNRIAVVTPLDAHTLAWRRRRGRLAAQSVAALGPALLDGLAALHEAGVAHGAVSPAAVGIDPAGRARLQDAALAPALSPQRADAAWWRRADVRDCTAMLRDLGRVPFWLEELLDPVASGAPGASAEAAELAAAWRQAASANGMAVPPRGSLAVIPDLVAPAAAPLGWRSALGPLRRLTRLSARWRRTLAALLALAGAGLPAAAWALPGGRQPFRALSDYLPTRAGAQLTYRLSGSLTASETLRVAKVGPVAGLLTVQLDSQTQHDESAGPLPLGLTGTTLRLEGDAIVRTASGGVLRDLVGPLAPGGTWSDHREGVAGGLSTTETRRVLGPVSLTVAGGSFTKCVVMTLESTVASTGGPGAQGTGTVWLCPSVGLAKASLRDANSRVEIELVSVS